MELVRFPLDGGGSVVVETDPGPGMALAGRLRDAPKDALRSFEAALAEVRDAASAALGQFQSMPRPPDEVEIKFGVRMDAEAGAVIAKTGIHGQFDISVKWQRRPGQDATGPPASPEAGSAPTAG